MPPIFVGAITNWKGAGNATNCYLIVFRMRLGLRNSYQLCKNLLRLGHDKIFTELADSPAPYFHTAKIRAPPCGHFLSCSTTHASCVCHISALGFSPGSVLSKNPTLVPTNQAPKRSEKIILRIYNSFFPSYSSTQLS